MATSFHKVNNNAASVLASGIDDNDLALSVSAGDGAEFDSVLQYLTLGRDETYAGEIVEASSRSTDAFTLTARAQDGTTATSHDAGDRVECLVVAAHITEIQDAINAIENGTTTLAKIVVDGSAASTMKLSDSGTNTVVSVLELYHMSSGTPASGLGAKLLLGAEDSAGNAEAAIEIHGILTTVTNTSEQGKFLLRVKNAGSFMDALKITVASNAVTIGSNQTTATLWNATATTVNAFGAMTTGNFGNNAGATTWNGNFTLIHTAANCIFGIRGDAGRNRYLAYYTGTTLRWSIQTNNAAESGSDAGSDLQISAWTDAGAVIDNPISIGRAATAAITIVRHLVGSASTTARATLRVPHGTAPTSPVDGDIWTTTAGLYVRINGATVGPLS